MLAPFDLPNLTQTFDSPQSREFDLNVTAITSESNVDRSETNQQVHVTVNVPLVVPPIPVTPSSSDPAFMTSPNFTVADASTATEFIKSEDAVADAERRSSELPHRPIEAFIPVGDLIALMRQGLTDWSEFVFSEVQPTGFSEKDGDGFATATSESASDRVESVGIMTAAETTSEEATSSFAWLWGAVRTFAGTKDERNEFSNNRRR